MAAKLLALFSGRRLTVHTWTKGHLTGSQEFYANEEGFADFGRYLKGHPATPLYILVDIVEEDFRLETVPHILGQGRKALVERKLVQTFRNEPYRHAEFQGRAPDGRKDDRLLLSALTHEEMLKPWVNAILDAKAPLAGIYSIPLLSQKAVDKLDLADIPHLLLVSTTVIGGLRQSYFQDGYLKFSRLIFAPSDAPESMARALAEEGAKIQQYLNNTRLLPREDTLHIHVLAREGTEETFRANCPSQAQRQFEIHSLPAAGRAMGLHLPQDGTCEQAFLLLLGQRHLPNQYAHAREIYFWRFNLAARAMRAFGIALVALGLLAALFNLVNMLELASKTDLATAQTQAVEAETRAIRNSFPPLPASPDTMKAAVDAHAFLQSHGHSPARLMQRVSQVMAKHPNIRLTTLQWWVGNSPDTPAPASTTQTTTAPGTPSVSLGEAVFEIMQIEAVITPITSHRAAITAGETFIADLGALPGLKVIPLSRPLDSTKSDQLQGTTDESKAPTAAFSLKLVAEPRPIP